MKVARKVSVLGFNLHSSLFEVARPASGVLARKWVQGNVTNEYGECHGQKNIRFRRGPNMIPLPPIDPHLVVKYESDKGKFTEQDARDLILS